MNEHVGDARIGFLNSAFYLVGNVVAFAHGNVAVHFNVKIDIKTQAHFSGKTFVDFHDTGHSSRGGSNTIDNFAARSRVHNFVERGFQQPVAVRADQSASKNRGPIIRALPGFATNQREGNSNKRGNRSQRIGAMMPGVGLQGGAFNVAPQPNYIAIQNFLHHHDDDEHDERKRRGTVMRTKKLAHALNGDAERGGQYADRDKNGGDRFGFAMSVRMSRVRRTRCDFQPAPNNDRTGNIERG